LGAAPAAVRLARWSARRPAWVIVAWIAFVIACFTAGTVTGVTQQTTADQHIGDASRAADLLRAGGLTTPDMESVLISSTADTGSTESRADSTTMATAAATIADIMRAQPVVSGVDPAAPAPNGHALLIRITLRGDAETAAHQRVQPLLDATAAVQRDYPTLRIEEAGTASIALAQDQTTGADFQRAELFSVPVTLLILLLAFGALVAAGIPVLLALSAVAAAIGLSAAVSRFVPVTGSADSMVLLIGMAVGVDYSLFYLRREREERRYGAGRLEAIELAAGTSGHAVLVSGTAVISAMTGLFLARDAIFSSLAVSAILVVAVAVLGSLTVLPAAMSALGRRIDRLRVPLLWRRTEKRARADRTTRTDRADRIGRVGPPRFWSLLLRPALRHPLITLVLSVAALLALASPALNMRLKLPGIEDVPRSLAVMRTYDRITAAFPNTGTAHQVVVRAPAGRNKDVRTELADLNTRLISDPLFVFTVPAAVRSSADDTITEMDVVTPYPDGSDQARQSLTELREQLVPATVGAVGGAEYVVGGPVAIDADYSAHTARQLPLVIAFVLLLTFLIMAVTFRSLVIALTAIVLNLLSAASAYGLLTWVFQGTWANGALDFRSSGAVVTWLPLFLFAVLSGLSMDYHVFVVSRIREAADRGKSTRDAVAEGITGSAGVVTSAAVVMVAVFAIFATLSTIDMKQLGVGLAAAILIDATIIRAVVLPSAMSLLGEANWWAPKFLRRITYVARHSPVAAYRRDVAATHTARRTGDPTADRPTGR
jgi:RND superfamily putative drug exporter